MKDVSSLYIDAMNEIVREQGHISVTLAEVNGVAQNEARFTSANSFWSDNTTPFNTDIQSQEYATFEEDFVRADGSMMIMPTESNQIRNVGFCSENVVSEMDDTPIVIEFGNIYSIKGLTIEFGETCYLTEFKICTNQDSEGTTYTNDSPNFSTTDTLGDIHTLYIYPINSTGGDEQRVRIKRILMGVGLSYGNTEISEATLEEEISSISEDLPETKLTVKVIDVEGKYNVNDTNSFIGYLTTGQVVTLSYGVTIDEDRGDIEWLQSQTLYLSDWSSSDGVFSFSATDLFSLSNDTYTLGNTIHTRTAMDEAVSILTDMGLTADDYVIDNYLSNIALTNPMPEDTHKNCLLLLCNACRCIFYQDEYGIINIKPNFALNIEPSDITLIPYHEAEWGNAHNVLVNSTVTTHYADFSKNVVRADGSMLILPENDPHAILESTGYVSEYVSNANGIYVGNPTIILELEAAFSFYSLYINFSGNPPTKLSIITYEHGQIKDTFTFTNLQNENVLNADFLSFDRMTIRVQKSTPYNRTMIDFIGLGAITKYKLMKDDMTSYLVGTKEENIKDVKVKVYTYENDENGKPQEVEDDVFYTDTINSTGSHIVVENPLISDTTLAQNLAEWLGTHYKNSISYDVDYRGDPRLNAADIIKVEDDYMNNLQTVINSHKLTFNGGFKGELSLRRAIKE